MVCSISVYAGRYAAEALVDPPGFCFCWAGARATYGFTHGKVSLAYWNTLRHVYNFHTSQLSQCNRQNVDMHVYMCLCVQLNCRCHKHDMYDSTTDSLQDCQHLTWY